MPSEIHVADCHRAEHAQEDAAHHWWAENVAQQNHAVALSLLTRHPESRLPPRYRHQQLERQDLLPKHNLGGLGRRGDAAVCHPRLPIEGIFISYA